MNNRTKLNLEVNNTYKNTLGEERTITEVVEQPWPKFIDSKGAVYNRHGEVWDSGGDDPTNLVELVTNPKKESTTKLKLTIQPGKTYVTNSGEEVTMELNYNQNGSYPFIGNNKQTYTENGCIFAWGELNDLDISHELIQDTEDENWHDNHCDDCCNDCDECELNDDPEIYLIDVLKFKQKSNCIKRKLTLKDYSDDSVEIIFKTKFSKDEPQVTTGIRLSYEAILMLYDSLEYMLEENQRTLH